MKRYIFKAISVVLCVMLIIPSVGMEFFAASVTESIADAHYENLDDVEVVDADTFEEFSQEASELISEQMESSDFDVEEAKENELYTCRVIVQADNVKKLSLEDYNPETIIFDEEDKLAVLQFSTEEQTKKCLDELEQNDAVNSVGPDVVVTTADVEDELQIVDEKKFRETFTLSNAVTLSDEEGETDSEETEGFKYQSWGIEAMHTDLFADYLKENGYSKNSVTVAVVDTGVEADHPFLEGKVLPGYDVFSDDNDPSAGHGHGTHVSGTIIDVTRGLNVNILPVKVTNDEGQSTSSLIALGVEYAANNGANVINISMGIDYIRCLFNIENEIDKAIENNITVCVAAGNASSDVGSSLSEHPNVGSCPAHDENAITVSSMSKNYANSYFSNFGSPIDFCAPGEDVISSWTEGRYAIASGTSMAAPHISAIAAMVKIMNPDFTPAEVEEFMKGISTDLGADGKDIYFGNGVVNFYNYFDHEHVESTLKLPSVDDEGTFDGTFKISCELCIKTLDVRKEDFTEVYDSMFANCAYLKKIVIPEGVTRIGVGAFYQCTNLESVSLPTTLEIIDDEAFSWCGKIVRISLPNGLKTIGEYAFNRTALVRVKIPDTVTSIEEGAFFKALDLREVKLSNNVKRIESYTFYACSRYLNMVVPDSVEYIGDFAFASGVHEGASITLPNSVTEIGKGAFYCSGITNIVLPSQLTEIKEFTFAQSHLKSIEINENLKSIGEDAFQYAEDLSLEEKLSEITLPSLEMWFNVEFANENSNPVRLAENLYIKGKEDSTSIVIPDGTTEIPADAFYGCTNITEITIPATVTSIGADAFYECTGLQKVNVTDLKAWSEINFENEYSYPMKYAQELYLNGELLNLDSWLSGGVTKIPDNMFKDRTDLTSIVIPDGITHIGNGAFSGCTNLESVVIPDSVLSIGKEAFYNCKSLTDINLPSKLAVIDDKTFYKCTSLSEIDIQSTVTEIGDYAFFSCDSLVSVNMAEGKTSIGNYCFAYCDKLENLNFVIADRIGTCAFKSSANIKNFNIDKITEAGSGIFDPSPYYDDFYIEKVNAVDLAAWFSYLSAIEGKYNCNPLMVSVNARLYINGSLLSGHIDIPEEMTVLPSYAFACCENVTSVSIHDKVTGIEEKAFSGCTSLKDVYITSLESWLNIDFGSSANPLRQAENLYLNGELVTDVVVPEGITALKDEVFAGYDKLKSITLPEGLVTIGAYSLYNCTALSDITIPDGVTAIGDYAFYSCGFSDITLPASVISIGNYAFSHCDLITDIVIPDSVTSLGKGLFAGCDILSDVTLPQSLTEITDSMFLGCSNLSSDIIPSTVTTIGNSAFSSVKSDKIIIPDSVVTIGERAFYKSEIKEIIIPDSVASVGESAFYGCTELENVVISSSVTSIEKYTFYNCTALKTITIPDSVVSFGDYAFQNCSSLESLTIPKNAATFGKEVFKNVRKIIFKTPRNIPAAVLYNCTGVEEVVLPSTLYTIGAEAFYGCSDLKKINLPDRLKRIDKLAFYGCKSLTSIVFPNTLTSYESNSFNGCTGVKSVTIGSGLSNPSLTNFVNLEEIYVDSAHATLSSDDYGVLYNKDKTELKKYPCNNPRTEFTIPDTVTKIGSSSFDNNRNLTKVNIPDSVTNIGYYAFQNSKSLIEVSVLGSVTEIGGYAFNNCKLITEITISSSVKNIGYSAFMGCTALNSVAILGKVENVDIGAFSGCTALEEVHISDLKSWCETSFNSSESNPLYYAENLYLNGDLVEGTLSIPEGTTEIGGCVFENYSKITGIVIPEGVTTINYLAFNNCKNVTEVTIPSTLYSLGNNCFYGCDALEGVYISDLESWCKISFFDANSNPLNYANKLYLNGELVTEVVVENGNISGSAFVNATEIKKVQLAPNATQIAVYTFSGCTSLEDVIIPETVLNVYNRAFDGCTNLKNVYYSESEAMWNNININNGNDPLLNATIHYAQKCLVKGHTPGDFVYEDYEGSLKLVQRCTVCGEILEVKDIVLADYSSVNEAITNAKALDSLLYSNFDTVQNAIDAVNFNFDIQDQETVDAYAAAINEAIAGLIKVVDDLKATNDASITQVGDTIYINSLPNVDFMALYNTGTISGTEIVVDMLNGTFKQLSDGRYHVKSDKFTFGEAVNGKYTGEVATTMEMGGQTFNLVFVINKFILRPENLRTLSVYETFVDSEAKTITLNTKSDAASITFWTATAGFTFEIDQNKYEGISKSSAYRYLIEKPASKQMVVEVLVNGEVYTMTINFVESPFTPSKYMLAVNGGLDLGKTAEGEEAIVVTMKPDKKYVGLKTSGIGGATLDIAYEGVDGLSLAKLSTGIEYVKAVSADESDIVTTITITLADGTVLEYPLVFRFADLTVSANAIQTINIENAKSLYDTEKGTMTFYSSSSAYARIRPLLTNGLQLTIDTSKYPFIIENNGTYEIKCPFNKTATFEISFNDPNETKVTATVYFLGYETEPYAVNTVSTLRGTMKLVDGELVFAISAGKSKITVNETLTSGETLVIDTNAYDFVTYADGAYTITKSGLGESVEFTISGNTYTATIAMDE